MSEMETSVNSVWTTRIGTATSIDGRALAGKTLLDHDGQKIGKITAAEFDHKSGRMDFMEVRRGGLLGYGTEWFMEPINRVAQVGNKTVTLR